MTCLFESITILSVRMDINHGDVLTSTEESCWKLYKSLHKYRVQDTLFNINKLSWPLSCAIFFFFFDNVRYGSHGPLFLQPSQLNFTYIIYINIYTLGTFILHSHAQGGNARALRSVYPFTYLSFFHLAPFSVTCTHASYDELYMCHL